MSGGWAGVNGDEGLEIAEYVLFTKLRVGDEN